MSSTKFKPGYVSPDFDTFQPVTQLHGFFDWKVDLFYNDTKHDHYARRRTSISTEEDFARHESEYYSVLSELPKNYKGDYKPYYVDYKRKFGFRSIMVHEGEFIYGTQKLFTDVDYWLSHINDIFYTGAIRVILD